MKTNTILKLLVIGLCGTALFFSASADSTSYTALTSNYIGSQEAKEVALNHAGVAEEDVSYIRSKLDFDDGIAEYDVEFWVGGVEYDYELNATSGAVVSHDYDAKYTSQVTDSQDYIGEDKAKSIALAHAGLTDASYIVCKFDFDDGVAEYEVEFWDGAVEYDYEINAITGDIIGYDYDMESQVPTASKPDVATTNSQDYIGEDKAKSVALAHAGLTDASYIVCKFDFDDGIAEYEVEFWDGAVEYDYEINAITGDIIGYDYDMESQAPASNVSTSTDYISAEQASNIALQDAGISEADASKLKCEFDFDDGRAEYEVEWDVGRMEYEYTISATDGTILERDAEYDD